MSRRYRLEQERAQQLTQELQEEEDKIKLQKDKIFGPIIWRRISEGIRIQDLQSDYYEETLDIIIEYYVRDDLLFRNTNILNDPDSLKSFRAKLLFSMQDRCSIIAVDEAHEGGVVGVLLLKSVKKCDYGRVFSRTQIGAGNCYQSITTFLNHVNKHVDIFLHYNCEMYLRYYLLCVKPEYRGKKIGFQLMDTGPIVAKHLGIDVIMGIFDCHHLQHLAQQLGMEKLFEQEYTKYRDKLGELKICDPGSGNYSCALMAGEIPSDIVRQETIKLINEDPPSNSRLSRTEKRKLEKIKKSDQDIILV